MGIARRLNELLEESDEPKLHMLLDRFRADHSTTPPTRITRTQRECDEQERQFRLRLRTLERTKPRLHAAVAKLLDEKDPLFPETFPTPA